MAKNEKEYQHYVPKFYLRFFSDNPKSVGTYIFKENKFIDQASLDGVGGKKFLYGENGEIENWFAELEGMWNKIICKTIESNKLEFEEFEEYVYLLMFVYLSDARSLEHAETMAKFINDLAVTMNNIRKEEKISYDKIITEEKIPNIYGISLMNKIVPLLLDLKLSLILNKTNNYFVTSDCIVIKYNQFLIEKGYKRGYGYGTQGIIILVPISPSHCICLYDADIYQTKEHDGVIFLKDVNEVNRMNKLFIYNSDKLIFFDKKTDKQRLKTYLKQERIKKTDMEIYQSTDMEYLFKMPAKSIDKNFNLNTFKLKTDKINIDLSNSAPQRLISKLMRVGEKDTPSYIIEKINGKMFYRKDKNKI